MASVITGHQEVNLLSGCYSESSTLASISGGSRWIVHKEICLGIVHGIPNTDASA